MIFNYFILFGVLNSTCVFKKSMTPEGLKKKCCLDNSRETKVGVGWHRGVSGTNSSHTSCLERFPGNNAIIPENIVNLCSSNVLYLTHPVMNSFHNSLLLLRANSVLGPSQ